MQFNKFFRVLNKKIEKYDKMASNPFFKARVPVTIVWIEDFAPKQNRNE